MNKMKYKLLIIFLNISFLLNAQFKKNGDPDMRFKANRTYSTPTYSAPISSPYTYQKSYTKKSTGTYVEGYYKTRRNNTNTDNMSTRGNFNPFKGIFGKRPRDYSVEVQNYGKGQVIHRGFFGGRYYINDMGKKVYVPKQ
jgi:hypothetical protein